MIVGVIRRKPVLTHASIVCEGMLASVNSVNSVKPCRRPCGGVLHRGRRPTQKYRYQILILTPHYLTYIRRHVTPITQFGFRDHREGTNMAFRLASPRTFIALENTVCFYTFYCFRIPVSCAGLFHLSTRHCCIGVTAD